MYMSTRIQIAEKICYCGGSMTITRSPDFLPY